MKKVKLATQDRSKHCSYYQCPYPSVISVLVEGKKVRRCQRHYDELVRHGMKFEALFEKANSIFKEK